MFKPSQPWFLSGCGVLVAAVVLASCTTAGSELATSGGYDDSLPFVNDDSLPFDESGPSDPGSGPVVTGDPAIIGPIFATAAAGPTVATAGDDGVWWLDLDGKAHLVLEPAIAADYDGQGGLVFQRSATAPIVRRTADAIEIDVVEPADGERLELIGVTSVNGTNEAIYVRTDDDAATVDLERIDLGGGQIATIGSLARDGVGPERLTMSGGYVSGVYRSGNQSGWATVSLASGTKLFGTPESDVGRCSDGPAVDCAEAVTTSADGSTVYRVVPSGSDAEGLDLIVNRASDFTELARVDLQRPKGGWHVTGLETTGALVIVSRAAQPDGSGSIAALVVEVSSGAISQLDQVGRATVISG